MYLVVEVLATFFVLGVFTFMFFKFWTDPEWWPRLGARLVFLLFSESERKSLAKRFPLVGHSYYGTTGDKEKDASIQRFDRVWSRGFVIVTLGGFLLVAVIAGLMALFG